MESILNVKHLKVAFYTDYGIVKAVNNVSFSVFPHETLGLVGESGSGKSVSAMSVMGLIDKPGYITKGEILFRGKDLLTFDEAEFNKIRGSELTMCFQNPMQALNPVLRIGEQIARVAMIHRHVTKNDAWQQAVELLREVNIPDAEQIMRRYPHQLSGGMCQRVMLVIALVCDPVLLILDEPTTGLDVTVQNQFLHLLLRLKEEKSVSQLLITHDLSVIAKTCNRVIVMYGGRIMELADVDALFDEPRHPYTRALLKSIPDVRDKKALKSIPGNVCDCLNLPTGCPFHPRCDHLMDVCRSKTPELQSVEKNQKVACHLY
jgi:oligopeptide/dipeptide ABC transporter ATP-binding protein